MVVTNFGLLLPDEEGSGRWQAVCDDLYGTARPELVRTDGRGGLFAATESSLWYTADGCAFSRSAGAVADGPVHDLAFDPQPPGRVWALAGEQRVLAVSADGGATFRVAHTFADARPYSRLLVAPSDSRRVYVTASGEAATWVPTILSSSLDGGVTWSTRDLAEGLVPAPQNTFTLMAVAPDNPQVLFLSLVDAYGDELWRSDDGGRSLKRVLKGGPRDWLTGLAFGPDVRTVYASAAVVPVIDMEPPGHLFISRDGGSTWAEPILADRTGPSYRCLHSAGGKLYACGLGEPSGEAFLVGSSVDEGKSWTPLARLQELTGVKSCVRARCAATEAWLCDRYNRCGSSPTPEPPSAPAADAATEDLDGRNRDCDSGRCGAGAGCQCDVGRGASGRDWNDGAGVFLVVLGLSAARSLLRRPIRSRKKGTAVVP